MSSMNSYIVLKNIVNLISNSQYKDDFVVKDGTALMSKVGLAK